MLFKPTAARTKRAARAVEALTTAADCIGPIESGMSLFAVTRGQFSMIDCIQHALREMGPSRLTLWTWCIAEYEVETFEWLLASGGITDALLVIDRSGEQQVNKSKQRSRSETNATLMMRWREKFGPRSIKVCLNHAKIATVDNGTHKVLIRGSMNLNMNPRFEQLDISEGGPAFDLVAGIESSLPVLEPNYTRRQVEDATGIHSLFTAEQLKPFTMEKIKVWAK